MDISYLFFFQCSLSFDLFFSHLFQKAIIPIHFPQYHFFKYYFIRQNFLLGLFHPHLYFNMN